VNNPATRYYLPTEWNQTLNLLSAPGHYTTLSGSIEAIRAAAQITSLEDTGLGADTDVGRAFVAAQSQAAMNRALGEAGYKAANDRMAAIQTLLDKVNDAPEQKDILDLQARIQAEQAMVQNENAKLLVMLQLQQAQRDIELQQAREISMKSGRSASGPARF
jgi:type IV secretion system protein VirB5